jgi:4-phosphopantoate--beta-alanine ligase
MFDVPKDHPRYISLMARHRLEEGLALGITTPTGMIAHGRGEAFDYLIGEKTCAFADDAIKAAAAKILLSKKFVISINGNTAMLVAEEMISLSKASDALLEVNLFHDSTERREKISQRFESFGQSILGVTPDAEIDGLSSARANVSSQGIYSADLVLVSLEDGDRTEALVRSGKSVIAIDLNPLSRTPQTADISIVDNVSRALPEIERQLGQLKDLSRDELGQILAVYDNKLTLLEAERAIRGSNENHS